MCFNGNTEIENDDILIFRTSITTEQDLKRIELLFAQYPCIHKWNADLEDWEKVLRIESEGISPTEVIETLQTINIYASELK